MDINEYIACRFYRIVGEHNIALDRVVEGTGISRHRLTKMATRAITAEELVRVAKYFRVPIDYFIGGFPVIVEPISDQTLRRWESLTSVHKEKHR